MTPNEAIDVRRRAAGRRGSIRVIRVIRG